MFDEFDFSVTQLTAIKDAMQNIPAFRPDNKQPAFVLGLLEASELARGTYGNKETTLKLARGNCKGACKDGRKLAIKAYGLMKDLYRSDPGATESIVSIPTKGHSVPRTIKRMTKTSEVWAQLPNMPGTTSPFVAGETTKENFDTALATLRTHQAAVSQANTLFQIAEGKLRSTHDDNKEFISAALIQGRKQFAPGTPERNVIDDIPTEENTPLPGQAVITEAESNEPGFVHLLFEAPHATRFVLLHKGPTDSAFASVYEGAANSYDPVNVEPGQHLYKAVPYNSRGSGPASAVVTVTVAAQAAA